MLEFLQNIRQPESYLIKLIEVVIHHLWELSEILNFVVHARISIWVNEVTEEQISDVIILQRMECYCDVTELICRTSQVGMVLAWRGLLNSSRPA